MDCGRNIPSRIYLKNGLSKLLPWDYMKGFSMVFDINVITAYKILYFIYLQSIFLIERAVGCS